MDRKETIATLKQKKKHLFLFGVLFGVICFLGAFLLPVIDIDWPIILLIILMVVPFVPASFFLINAAILARRILALEVEEKQAILAAARQKKEQEEKEQTEKARLEAEEKEKERLRGLESRRQERIASLAEIWPYGTNRMLAILEGPHEGDDENCTQVWVDVDEQARIVIRYGGMFFRIAAVKSSGLYAVSDDHVIILTRDRFTRDSLIYKIVDNGVEATAYRSLSSISDKAFIDASYDLSNKDLVEMLPRNHYSFTNESFFWEEQDFCSMFITNYFKVMSNDRDVVFSPVALALYKASHSYEGLWENVLDFLTPSDNMPESGFQQKAFKMMEIMREIFITAKKEHESVDYNDVAFSTDDSEEFARVLIKTECIMHTIEKILSEKGVLKYYPNRCDVDLEGVTFSLGFYVEQPRITDFDAETFISSTRLSGFIRMFHGFLVASSAINLRVTLADGKAVKLSYVVEKNDSLVEKNYIAI